MGVYLVEIQHQYIIKERGDLSCRASKAYYRRLATLKAASRFYNPDADNRQVTTDCRPTFLFLLRRPEPVIQPQKLLQDLSGIRFATQSLFDCLSLLSAILRTEVIGC